MTTAHLYVVAYDISCPRRYRKTVKELKRFCERSQLSVFICRASPARIRRLETSLRRILHPDEDRLMILDLGNATDVAAQLTNMNAISDIGELETLIV
jgi:CRISPR-associated protein Cas2